jgi:hypothetical protein
MAPVPAVDPAAAGNRKATPRLPGRATVLVAVLIAVLVAVLVTAPGDGPRPGGGPRRGREPEGDATASWPSNGISNGISSGTRDREGRGAGEPEAPGQWHRDPNPRPSLSVSGEFSGKLGILSAASPRSSPQSRGIYGRLARAQPGVSRDPTPPNAPPMRAEARSRRPVSPIPGLPGKEGAGEVDMRGEGSWSGEGVPGKAMLGAESVALSFAPRLLPPPACPALPRPPFCARSVCPPHPFSLLLCFQGLASFSPGLLFVRPGFRAAIPGENPVRPGFSAWRNPALAVSDPGTSRCSIELPDWPRGIRTALGEIHRRDPGARRRRGGLRAEQCH